mmetsp:Transcript_26664/g.79540  ORF Transcript_26664/g.79540 Transcript_26664/m.79540 type:complete len:267 (+) Transcript_26664:162-962(+)
MCSSDARTPSAFRAARREGLSTMVARSRARAARWLKVTANAQAAALTRPGPAAPRRAAAGHNPTRPTAAPPVTAWAATATARGRAAREKAANRCLQPPPATTQRDDAIFSWTGHCFPRGPCGPVRSAQVGALRSFCGPSAPAGSGRLLSPSVSCSLSKQDAHGQEHTPPGRSASKQKESSSRGPGAATLLGIDALRTIASCSWHVTAWGYFTGFSPPSSWGSTSAGMSFRNSSVGTPRWIATLAATLGSSILFTKHQMVSISRGAL